MITFNNIDNFIFDLDGTLIDSDSVYEDGWRHAFMLKKIPVDNKLIEGLVGLSVKESTSRIASHVDSLNLALELRNIRENYFFERLKLNKVNLMPYVTELLDFLKFRNIQIGLATSTFEEKGKQVLTKLDLEKYFSHSTFGDQITISKPNPEIYNSMKLKMGATPSNTIVIEDSIVGANAALAANFSVFLVPYHSAIVPNDIIENSGVTVFKDLSEVKNFLID